MSKAGLGRDCAADGCSVRIFHPLPQQTLCRRCYSGSIRAQRREREGQRAPKLGRNVERELRDAIKRRKPEEAL